jgi:hypothetical protein
LAEKPGANVLLAGYMKDWYLSFAIASDPNKFTWLNLPDVTRPLWPTYGEYANVMMATDQEVKVIQDPDAVDLCTFWRNSAEITRI